MIKLLVILIYVLRVQYKLGNLVTGNKYTANFGDSRFLTMTIIMKLSNKSNYKLFKIQPLMVSFQPKSSEFLFERGSMKNVRG